jgi:hypothetical protein
VSGVGQGGEWCKRGAVKMEAPVVASESGGRTRAQATPPDPLQHRL